MCIVLVIVSASNVGEMRSEWPVVTCVWAMSEYVHYAVLNDRCDVISGSMSDVNPVVPI